MTPDPIDASRPRRRGRPALPAEHHRRRLIEGALEVLSRGPGVRLRIADVTTAAQMSTKSFYEHFASKDELVLAIFEYNAQRFLAQTRRTLDDEMDPEETARRILRSFLSLFPATVLHFETAYPRQLAKLRAMRRAAVEAATNMAFEHLVRLHGRNEISAEPNRVVVEFAITGALDLAIRYFAEGRIQEIVEHEADFTRAVIRALDLPVSRLRVVSDAADEGPALREASSAAR